MAIAGILAGACAPTVDGPRERQRAIDRDDSDRLALQLQHLPGVVTASVVLHHATRDPLGTALPVPSTFAAVLVTDDRADLAALRGIATRLARAALPDASPTIELVPALHRAELARVGPFTVEASSRGPLRAVLALAFLAIAALAGVLAVRERRHRRGSSAQ